MGIFKLKPKIDLKLVHNKSNGQINLSLPKKKLPQEVVDKLNSKKLSIIFDGWED